MTRPPLKNVGASVRTRLTDQARARGDNAQLLMLRFAIERLLYRLGQSAYRDQFVLKGAMLFSLWAPVPYRSTGDLDLLGQAIRRPCAWLLYSGQGRTRSGLRTSCALFQWFRTCTKGRNPL